MAEHDTTRADAPAPAPAPPPEPPKPRRVALRVESDGHPGGTRLVDAATGEALTFDAHCRVDAEGIPGRDGKATVTLVFSAVPVTALPAAGGPFRLVGASAGCEGHSSPPAAAPAPAPSHQAPAGSAPGAAGAAGLAGVSLAAALAHNKRLNEGR